MQLSLSSLSSLSLSLSLISLSLSLALSLSFTLSFFEPYESHVMLKIYVSTASVSELCYMLQYTVIYA